MKDTIHSLNESSIFARIIETGAGVPIASKIFDYPGASKTIYSSESYYSQDAFDYKFGGCEKRSVSPERLKTINDHPSVKQDFVEELYNVLISTSFQVGDKKNHMATHGWISVNVKNESIRYYHVSIHEAKNRKKYIREIGRIGIFLLLSKNEHIPLESCVDIVLDENLNPLYETTLEYVKNTTIRESAVVFTTDGKIDRVDPYLRDIETLIVYKGSFNPPTLSHKEIIEKSEYLYGGSSTSLFCLNFDTYQKGIQSVDSLLFRIKLINKMGWNVLITTKPYFKDTYDMLRLKYHKKIVFPQGVDTINRMETYYLDTFKKSFNKKSINKDFESAEFLVFNRDSETLLPKIKENLLDTGIIKLLETDNPNISSTKVRKLLNEDKHKEIENLVPSLILSDLKGKKFN